MTDAEKRFKFEERLKTIVGGYCYAQDGGNGGYEFGDIVKHIDESINQAIAEERARIVYEIKGLMKVSKTEWTALDDLLASLDKPVTDKNI